MKKRNLDEKGGTTVASRERKIKGVKRGESKLPMQIFCLPLPRCRFIAKRNRKLHQYRFL